MVQATNRSRFLFEASSHVRVACVITQEKLDCKTLREHHVLCQPDRAHSAFAQWTNQPVITDHSGWLKPGIRTGGVQFAAFSCHLRSKLSRRSSSRCRADPCF